MLNRTPKKACQYTKKRVFCFILRVTHQFHSKNEGTPLKQNLQVDHLNLASVFPISAEMKTDTGPTSYSQS
jgi:hypothetical protein